MEEVRQHRVEVTFFNEQGDTCTRIINTAISAAEVRMCMPIIPARIERRKKKK